MTLYSITLFLHIAAVLVLFASLSFEVLSLFHLRRASDLSDVHRWIDPVPGIRLLAIGSILVVLFSGVYLAVGMSAFDLAWPKVAIVALLLIATLGALTGKRRRAIRSSAPAAKMKPELLRQLQDPFLKISLGIRIAVFLGVVLLMAATPELWQSIAIVIGSVVLGLLLSVVAWRRTGPLPSRGELQSQAEDNFPVLKTKEDTWRSF
jgi:hypothetical protein